MKRTLFGFGLGLCLMNAASAAPRTTPGVLPPNSTAYGKTYAEWAVAWWQWMMGMPASQNPNNDPSETPANMLIGQTGHVLFPPVFGGNGSFVRRVTLPSGHPLLFPVLTTNGDNYGVHPPIDLQIMQADLTWSWNHATVAASVDGVPVRDLDQYRSASFGTYFIPQTDNLWQYLYPGIEDEGGWYDFVTQGWWIMLAPPSIGHHVVKTSYRIYYPEFDPPNDFRQDATFYIDIVPAGQFKK